MHLDLKYRPDIDGLRAIAVLAVVAFHAFPNLLPGGFVGVDVFFVISGYLISGIILDRIAGGNFSFADFYARRVRRIFPALALVLAASLVAGWFLLLPGEYTQLGKHIAAGGGFASNFILWSESGYFDNSGYTKPLLHLWSLGVEEQFYLVWPVSLLVLSRLRRHLPVAIAAILLASFALNVVVTSADKVAGFYSPATRLWELLAGALLAALHARQIRPFVTGSVAATVGLAAIAAAFVLISPDRAFPGWWAALPVVGTALIIAAAPASPANRLLSCRPLVWIGLISYPLYLWHWPMLSFATIAESATPPAALRVAAIAASVLLAWATYRFVEAPIRFGLRRRIGTPLAGGAVVALTALGFAVYAAGGLPGHESPVAAPAATTFQGQDAALPLYVARLRDNPKYVEQVDDERSVAIRAPRCHANDEMFAEYRLYADECLAMASDRKNVLIVGDSHAADLYVALSMAYPEINFLQATGIGCTPASLLPPIVAKCPKFLAYAFDFADSHQLDGVVLSAIWDQNYYWVASDILRLKNHGHRVVIVGPPLEFTSDVPKIIQRHPPSESLDSYLAARVKPEPEIREREMAEFARDQDVGFIPYIGLYCSSGGCPALNNDGELLILDPSHLSVAGAKHLGAAIRRDHALERALGIP